MADYSAGVKIVGLKEIVDGFRRINREYPKALRVAFRAIAKFVVASAQDKMEFGPGEAASSLKAVTNSAGAGITYPGGGVPWKGVKADYYPWLDFGGTTGRGHNSFAVGSRNRRVEKRGWGRDKRTGAGNVQREWRGKPSGSGRYLYPAIKESRDVIHEASAEAIEQVAKAAGFETH